MNKQEQSKTISIVGAGFCGTTIAVQQAMHYKELIDQGCDLSPLKIQLIDASGNFGPGLPYSTKDNVFLLNQNTDEMSPFPKDPGHFTAWCIEKGHATC